MVKGLSCQSLSPTSVPDGDDGPVELPCERQLRQRTRTSTNSDHDLSVGHHRISVGVEPGWDDDIGMPDGWLRIKSWQQNNGVAFRGVRTGFSTLMDRLLQRAEATGNGPVSMVDQFLG